jgi:hypothetical protein
VFSTNRRRYPQVYQHNLLINKDLRRLEYQPFRRRLLWDESHGLAARSRTAGRPSAADAA